MKRGWQRIALVLAIIIGNVILDQATKSWATASLQHVPPETYWGGFFRLTYVENTGAFLSGGSSLPEGIRYWVLSIFPTLLLLGLMYYTMFSKALNKWQIIGLAFIVGGGLSNIYDRLLYGRVVDFMNMGLGELRTGIFNFADVSIMVGLAIMLPFAFRKPTAAPEPADEVTNVEPDTTP